MKKEKQSFVLGFLGGLIGGALAAIGVTALSKHLKEKKSGVIDLTEINPSGAQDIITFTMKNSTNTPQKITIFNGYSLTPIQLQNPNISISSTPSLEYFIRTLAKEPKQLDRVVVKCGKSSFDGDYSNMAPPMAPPAAPPAPAPKPVAPVIASPVAPPKPVAPVAPPAPPAANQCQQQIEQPFLVEYKDANGQAQSTPIFPMVSAWQKQGNMALADMKNIVLDAETVIKDYTVMPKTSVTMIFFWKDSKKKK